MLPANYQRYFDGGLILEGFDAIEQTLTIWRAFGVVFLECRSVPPTPTASQLDGGHTFGSLATVGILKPARVAMFLEALHGRCI